MHELPEGFKILFSPNDPCVIVARTLNGIKCLRFRCCPKELFSHGKGDDFVLVAVDDQLGNDDIFDFLKIVVVSRQ